jgi:hypothetical protein
MSWIIAGAAAVGVMQGMANQKKMARHNQYRAEVIRHSPWTGMGDPGEKELPDALQSGLQGAMTGATLKGAMGSSGGAAGAEGAKAGTATNMATPEMYQQGAPGMGGGQMIDRWGDNPYLTAKA